MNDGPNPQKSLEIKKKSDFETEIAFPETSRVFPSNPSKTGTVPVPGLKTNLFWDPYRLGDPLAGLSPGPTTFGKS
jgi:hypothetical protein